MPHDVYTTRSNVIVLVLWAITLGTLCYAAAQ